MSKCQNAGLGAVSRYTENVLSKKKSPGGVGEAGGRKKKKKKEGEEAYQPRKRTLVALGNVQRSLRKTRVVGRGPLVGPLGMAGGSGVAYSEALIAF